MFQINSRSSLMYLNVVQFLNGNPYFGDQFRMTFAERENCIFPLQSVLRYKCGKAVEDASNTNENRSKFSVWIT